MTREQAHAAYEDALNACPDSESQRLAMRRLSLEDLFYLLVYVLKRWDADRDWIYDRCREVELHPDNHVDLWARFHYKSTIQTFAKTIQDILNHPDWTFGIFSHTRPIAKGFLRQIKREFEGNDVLKWLFPDILYTRPDQESFKWSEDDGIIVKRKSNPKESTVEAWGLVDGQPTSRHFDVMIYDDVVTLESVSTPEMINKTTKAWEISLNLLSERGVSRYVGTRYHFSDTYKTIIEREAAIPRIHTATEDGTFSGKPVLISKEKLGDLIKRMGSFTASCQLFLDPLMDDVQRFDPKWVRYWTEADASRMNIYLLVDPANDKKKKSDYTAMFVIGVDEKDDYYVLDMVRDRLNLTERADKLFELHRQWKPIRVGYEKYGMQADIEHFKDKMEQDNYYFGIEALGGNTAKFDRIRRLVPLFEAGRLFFPKVFVRKTYEGVNKDLVGAFLDEEYKAFPFGAHDDMLDCLARITDENMAVFPTKYENFRLKPLSTIIIDSLEKKSTDDEFEDYVASEMDAYERAMGYGHREMELIYDRV